MKVMPLALFAGLATLGAAAVAQPGWELIGSRSVGLAVDRDVISVRGRDRHRQLRLCAAGGAVHIIDLDIRFANGGHQDVPMRARLRAGGCTRVVDLVGQNRNITEIRILYQRLRRRAPAQVRVWAR